MIEAIIKLINSQQGCYEIYQRTGVSQGVISELHPGYRTVGDVSLVVAEN
ncbi:hypothetical protein [Staphylococcus felis]|nr:hypothetical protein [Staphylococcus felis]